MCKRFGLLVVSAGCGTSGVAVGMGKRKRVGGSEIDAFSQRRQYLCFMKRGYPKIKRGARRRERRATKQRGYDDA